MITERLLLCVAVVTTVNGYASFKDRIPNGQSVPNPCNPESVWKGVGHMNKLGGGARNPFGSEFDSQGSAWTHELCMADSDGDGMANGKELGDPNCTWTSGSTSYLSTGLSHPGICEPIDSAKCKAKNDFLDCEESGFVCDGINEPGIVELDARLTETVVPAKETTYMCQSFEFDTSKDYHVVAAVPIIDNINVMHHLVIYGCDATMNVTDMKTPRECFMETPCVELMFVWAFRGQGTCVHKDTGFRVGANGFKTMVMEVHWNNPMEESTYRDSSGMKLYLTPNLRPYDAGVMSIGESLLVIPPGREDVSINGTCPSECTKEEMEGPIHIFGVLNHMHYLGASAETEIVSSATGQVTQLAVDHIYDYKTKPTYYSFDEPHIAYPGDEYNLECHFNSTSRTKTTFFGSNSAGELCFAFLMYYPRQNGTGAETTTIFSFTPGLMTNKITVSSYDSNTNSMDDSNTASCCYCCTSHGNIASCEWGKPVIGGCDRDYFDPANEKGQKVHMDVGTRCLTSICLEECKSVARELKKNPCFQYPLKFIILQSALDLVMNVTQKLQAMEMYYKMDSCAAELERESWIAGN